MSQKLQMSAQRWTLLLAILLLAVLAVLWSVFNQSSWKPPLPRMPDYAASLHDVSAPVVVQLSDSDMLLAHPLFEMDRKPPMPKIEEPEPENKSEPEKAPDNLDKVQLEGVYDSPSGGIIIVSFEGKNRRVRVGEELEGWRVEKVLGRSVHLSRAGSEERVLELKRKIGAPAASSPAPANNARAAAARRPPAPR